MGLTIQNANVAAENRFGASTPALSVVVGTSGNRAQTHACLQAINATCMAAGSVQTILLDNASSDHAANGCDGNVEVMRSETYRPWDVVWADGISQAKAAMVLLISADVICEAGWLSPVLQVLMEDATCNAVSPGIAHNGELKATQPPADGNAVCLLVRRSALIANTVRDVRYVPMSRVHVAVAPEQTDVAQQTEPTMTFEAPGGGAPVAPDVWIGDPNIDMSKKHARLNLGCGNIKIRGWTNVDGDPICNPDMTFDLRERLPFEDATVEMIYSEHLFEHFPLEQAVALMAECRRILTPDGVMRIAMPDMHTSVMGYLNRWQNSEWVTWFPEIDTPARALNMCFNSWGHQYLYDREDLTLRLQTAGFTRVNSEGWGVSRWPELCGLESRKESCLIVEVQR